MKKLRLLLLLATFVACSGDDVYDPNSAESAFKSAEKLEKDERFEESVSRYKEVQNRHPYSRYAVEARMRIADIQYSRENWEDAQVGYQLFKELHPKHEKIDYVTFRLGMSYYQQLPSTIDRDLSVSAKAINAFEEIIKSYPGSANLKEASEKRNDILRMLSEKEDYIGNFYFIREMYDSAFRRYEHMADLYSRSALAPKALSRAAISAFRSGELEKGRSLVARLKKEHPSSPDVRDAEDEQSKHGLR